jgi:hypothetical protein
VLQIIEKVHQDGGLLPGALFTWRIPRNHAGLSPLGKGELKNRSPVFRIGCRAVLFQTKNYRRILINVADLGCVSRIRFISIPNPGSDFFPSRIRIKEFLYLTQKLFFKLSEIWSGLFILDPDPDFLTIPDPGVKKAPEPDPEHWF